MKKLELTKKDGFVSVDAKDLVEAVKALKVFASKWDVLQLSSHNSLLFIACVGETNSLRSSIPCIPSPDFPKVCCTTLGEFSKSLPKSGQVNLQVVDGRLIVDTSELRTGISLLNPEGAKEFPYFNTNKLIGAFDSNFWDKLDFVIPAMSKDELFRENLHGVLIDGDALVATDGARLHKTYVAWMIKAKTIDNVFIPSLAVNALQKVRGGKVIIHKAKDTLQFNVFRNEAIVLSIQVQDPGVAFPDYKLAIPNRSAYTSKVTLNGNSKKQLISLRKAVLKEQRDDFGYEKGAIKLSMGVNQAVVGSTWEGKTTAELTTTKTVIQKDIVFGVNSQYLIDAFGDEKSITVCFDNNYPGCSPMFVDFEDPNKFALIMPVRTN